MTPAPRRKRRNFGPVGAVGKVWCQSCNKYGWHTRKDAKKIEKEYPEEQLRPYRCPVEDNIWHLGHLPKQVRRGDIAADDWYDN